MNLYNNIAGGIVVYPKIIEKHVQEELPFMATENILMEAVKRGGDRQELHERIRIHSMEAGKQVKLHGLKNDLIDRIAEDTMFGMDHNAIHDVMKPQNYIGRSEEQVAEYIEGFVQPKISAIDTDGINIELNV
mgnify:CR=1 FL=1